jgi:predicted NBD/HSP70 family sugar kinase
MVSKKPHNQTDIKKHNTGLILSLIRAGNESRASLAKKTGMSPASVTRITETLMKKGIVKEMEKFTGGLGRRAVSLALEENTVAALGININADYTEICIVNFTGTMLGSLKMEDILPQNGAELWIRALAQASRKLAKDLKVPWNRIKTAGVSCMGIVNKDTGMAIFAPSLKMWNYPLAENLERSLSVPIVLEHDQKAGLLGETILNPALAKDYTVLFSAGAGVGSAIMENGYFIRGSGYTAGEIGHTIVVPGGELCNCGRRGCLQTLIAEHYILKRSSKYVKNISNLNRFFEYYRSGVSWAVDIYNDLILYLSMAVENLACLYDPKTIILGGRLFDACPEIVDTIRRHFSESAYLPVRDRVNLIIAHPGGQSYMIGAALIGLRHFEEDLVDNISRGED